MCIFKGIKLNNFNVLAICFGVFAAHFACSAASASEPSFWMTQEEVANSGGLPKLSSQEYVPTFGIDNYLGGDNWELKQLTLFEASLPEVANSKADTSPQRFDRYRDTQPTIYRLTLKGYSVFESKDWDENRYWTLDKVKNRQIRKSQIMLSFSKKFR